MASRLEELQRQAEELNKAIEEEKARQAALAEGGVIIDMTEVERRLDAVVINGANAVKLLQRLNQVSDNIYLKLEELSLKLLEVMAIGMPLLQRESNKR